MCSSILQRALRLHEIVFSPFLVFANKVFTVEFGWQPVLHGVFLRMLCVSTVLYCCSAAGRWDTATAAPETQGVTAKLSATACYLSDRQEQGLKSESCTENLTVLRTVVCPAC